MKKLYKLCLAALALPMGLSAQIDLVINEISYNPITPGTGGIEYLELYNNSAGPVELEGYRFVQTANNGMNFTFPAHQIQPGEYVVISNDSAAFQSEYNVSAYEFSGFILNAGYTCLLEDSTGAFIDSVRYENTTPWPLTPNGQGTSMELCDPMSDNNDPGNWVRATNDLGTQYRGRKHYGTPGAMNSTCTTDPIFHMRYRTFTTVESAGNLEVNVYLENANGTTSEVSVMAVSGTADISTDIIFNSNTKISGNQDITGSFFVQIVDDTILEPAENFYLILHTAVNSIISNDTIEITIAADGNDNPVNRHMKLIGVADAATNAPRLIEVMAIENIPDMSLFGLGVANNGGGTDGEEYTFPAVPGVKGQHYFVTNDSAGFVSYFGFAPDFIGPGGQQGMFNYNGDDAVELYENDRVIDVYGDPNTDGTGEVWEYVNGWGKRVDGTGPDDRTFVPANWTFGGIDALQNSNTNDEASKPYPLPQDTTSVRSISGEGIVYTLFPNPANDFVRFQGSDELDLVTVTDLTGKVIASAEGRNELVEIDLTTYQAGVYIVRFIETTGRTTSYKLIVE